MRVRSLGFRTDLAVLRAGGSSITHADDHVVVRTPLNCSYWWGNFVLVPDPDQLVHGVELFSRLLPEAGHTAIGVDGTDGVVPSIVGDLGLEAEANVVLIAPSFESATPTDAEVRVLTTDEDWEALLVLRCDYGPEANDLAFARGRVADARRVTRAGTGCWLGAYRSGKLVASLGVVDVGGGTARYQDVQTHSDHRRRGLAAHLVAVGAEIARRRWAADRLVIVADPDGPAIALYRRLGFRDSELQVRVSRGQTTPGGGGVP